MSTEWTKIGQVGLGAAFAAGVFLLGVRSGHQTTVVSAIGRNAPSVEVRRIDEASARRIPDNLHGQVVVLNVWATWCTPCRQEMASLQSLQDDMRDRGLHVVGLNVDQGSGAVRTVKEFVERNGISFEIVRETTPKVMSQYAVSGLPTTFVVDRNGVVRRRIVGGIDWHSARVLAYADTLLRENVRE